MALRTDSYGSVAEVVAFTRHLLDDQLSYNSTTLPTLTEVEKFIDRASGVINGILATKGFAVPITNSTAKLSLDNWVVAKASEYVELTQRGAGYSGDEASRTGTFGVLSRSADEYVDKNALGWKRMGVTVAHKLSEGLKFTGETAQADRTDQDDGSLEQPKFKRGLWDNG